MCPQARRVRPRPGCTVTLMDSNDRGMRRAGTNLNQVTKAINVIKFRFKLGFEGEEEYRNAVYMTGYAAEKLSWRSKDVQEVVMKFLFDYLPDDEDE